MKLFAFEWIKIFQKKFLWGVLIFLLCLNGILLFRQIDVYQDEGGVQENGSFFSEYDSYLDYIEEQNKRLSGASIFAQKDSFSYRNRIKTQAVYEKLGKVKIIPDISGGVRLVTNWRITDVLLLISVLIFVLEIFLTEREEGSLSLIKPTKYGSDRKPVGNDRVCIVYRIYNTAVLQGKNNRCTKKEKNVSEAG